MIVNRRDLLAGFIFLGFGAFYSYYSLAALRLGTGFQMGPGYFPLMLGVLLIFLGLLIVVQSFFSCRPLHWTLPWRGIILISLSTAIFGLTVRLLGFGPSLAVSILTAAFGSRHMTLLFAVALALGLTAFCLLVFKVGLGLPLPVFGRWLR